MKVNFCNYITSETGTSWGPRSLNDWETIYFVDGAAVYEHPGGTLEIRRGEVLTIRPGERHTLTCLRRTTISCIHLEPDAPVFLPRRLAPEVDEARRLHDTFRQCAEEFAGHVPDSEGLLVLMAGEIWQRLRRCAAARQTSPSPLLRRMLEWIEQRPDAGLDRNTLAEHFKVTPEHVNYCFRRELGTTPGNYINRRRIYRAYQLLQTECRSVKEAAGAVGFSDEYYFARLFKRITGVTPGSIKTLLPGK